MEPIGSTELASGRYRIERFLGEGASRRVYVARDTHLDRDVALAFLKTGGLGRADVERLRDAAGAMAGLGSHPNVVTLYDVGEHEGWLFVATEYVPGGTLRDRLDAAPGGRLDPGDALRLTRDLAAGLAHAHRRGVLHRDLHAGNVRLAADGTAKVGDFASSVSRGRGGTLSAALSHLAPEAAVGRPADHRADLYALGVLLYEMLTGRPPFPGDDPATVLARHIHAAPTPPGHLVSDVPVALDRLALALLAKVPEDRPDSAAAVGEIAAAIETGSMRAAIPSPGALDRLTPGAFVGRQSIMDVLDGALDAAFDGRRTTVLLTGDPGIGKTRTAEQLATHARLRGARVLVGRCWEHGAAPAYWPWTQILRALLESTPTHAGDERLASLASIVPELRRTDAPRRVVASAAARFRLAADVADVLRRAATAQPLVVVVDDLHGADQASAHLLRYVARENPDARLLVVATYREVDVGSGHPLSDVLAEIVRDARTVRLPGLDAAAVTELIERTTGALPPAGVAAAVHDRTGGNPLFVAEIVRLAAADGALDRVAATAWRLPNSVRAVLLQRLAHVPEPARRVLACAAVVGREFDLDVLERLADDAACVRAAIDRALAAGLVEPAPGPSGRFRFFHALVRDALDEELRPEERRRLHVGAAVAITACRAGNLDAHSATLAHHHFEAGTLDQAVVHAVRAAEHASARYAHDNAAEHYEFALDAAGRMPPDDHRRCSLLIALGRERWRTGRTTAARAAFLARAALGFAGRTDITLGVNADAVRLLEESLAALGEREPALRAEVEARLATELYFDATAAGRRERLSRDAMALAEAHGDAALQAYVASARHFVQWRPGTLSERIALADRMCALAERAGAKDVLHFGRSWRVVDLLEAGDLTGADRAIGDFARLAAELHDAHCDWLLATFRATRALADGRHDDAERLVAEVLAAGQRAETPNALMVYGVQLFLLRRDQGRLDEITPLFEAFAAEHGELPGLQAGLAELHAECGRLDRAQALLDRIEADEPRHWDWLAALASLSRTCALLGDVRRAGILYRLLAPHAGVSVTVGYGGGWDGSVAHYLGVLATVRSDFDVAVRHFADAETAHRRAGADAFVAHTEREHARMLLRRARATDRAEATRRLRNAARIYGTLGMRHHLAGVRALAVESPETAGSAPAPAPNLFALDGDAWSIVYAGTAVRLPDTRGLRYIARLLATPDREVHVIELIGLAASGSSAAGAGGASAARAGGADDAALDARALDEYRRRLAQLADVIRDAERANDGGRLERARDEHAAIEDAVVAAMGVGGRRRPHNHPVERARKAVYNRVRSALAVLDAAHPTLGRHVARSIRTGTYCVYRPERSTAWRLG